MTPTRSSRYDVIENVRGWEGQNREGRIWDKPSYHLSRTFHFSLLFFSCSFTSFSPSPCIFSLFFELYALLQPIFFLLSLAVFYDSLRFLFIILSRCILLFSFCFLTTISLFVSSPFYQLNFLRFVTFSLFFSFSLFPISFQFSLFFFPFHSSSPLHRSCLVLFFFSFTSRLFLFYFTLFSVLVAFPFAPFPDRFHGVVNGRSEFKHRSGDSTGHAIFPVDFATAAGHSRWTERLVERVDDEGSWNSSTLSSLWSLGYNGAYTGRLALYEAFRLSRE